MYRYLVAHIPGFRLERCGWRSSQEVVLVQEQQNALRIQSCTPPTRSHGIEPGMSLAAARVRLPHIAVEQSDPVSEAEDLNRLAEQLLRFSPCVGPMPPDSIVAEVGRTRLPHHRLGDVVGQERSLIERTRIRLKELGHSATVVISDDPETARMLARWGNQNRVIAPGQGRQALSELPLDALSLPPAEQQFLQNLGIVRIGDFTALPSAAIANRLGAVGVTAHSMAKGNSPIQVLSPWTEQNPLVLSQDFPDPVLQLDALLFVLNALLRDACSRLITVGQAASQLSLLFTLEEGAQRLSIQLGEPTRSTERILRVIRHRLEHFKLAGAVTSLSIEVSESSPFHGRQTSIIDRSGRSEAIADVTARLQDSLGRSRVSIPEHQSRHRPETAWLKRSVQATALDTSSAHQLEQTEMRILEQDPVHHWNGKPVFSPPPRPPLLVHPPFSIDVRTPKGGIPLAVQVEEQWIEIVATSGPEQIDTEWWVNPLRREYWRVQLQDGRSAWIYQEDGQWALHGWWDQ